MTKNSISTNDSYKTFTELQAMNLKVLEIASWRPTNQSTGFDRFLLVEVWTIFPPKLAPSCPVFFVGDFFSTDLCTYVIVETNLERSLLTFSLEFRRLDLTLDTGRYHQIEIDSTRSSMLRWSFIRIPCWSQNAFHVTHDGQNRVVGIIETRLSKINSCIKYISVFIWHNIA